MVAYSFKAQFREPILTGIKRQTIRADRKRHARAGETLQLYTGMRTKYCRAIGTGTCDLVAPITIDLADNSVLIGPNVHRGWASLDELAHKDGFDSWLAMREFWRENHGSIAVFSGVLIRWTDFVANTPATGGAADG